MKTQFDLYLASRSPRRRELLTQVGISFAVLDVDIDESEKDNELAEDYVVRLAREKAVAGWNQRKSIIKPVLGSDTAVVINGTILGKPENQADASRMLGLLSGKTHQVMTAVALLDSGKNTLQTGQYELNSVINVSDVTFKVLSDREIEQYIQSGECHDKAGAYAIQGRAAAFITNLSGSYSGVMGLPIFETLELLNKASISTEF
ncbi:MAG: Maf-like protein [Gammaproteobacteria bacterium]|nr:Maf-like protein [Gammaproteobacteria bacterium]MCW8986151.1 Maf-like protein [Gammaproteobacteria bacterium]MCW9030942.1 Maf-like protein [Gammaproteobacteria bacterium]